jgi:isoprenylcysteine carboxyl methyltransferase (ICMT) family protein YpbQ
MQNNNPFKWQKHPQYASIVTSILAGHLPFLSMPHKFYYTVTSSLVNNFFPWGKTKNKGDAS